MTKKILVLGSVNVDLVIRAQRLPRPGETVTGGTFFQAGGGKGANQALAATRAGRQQDVRLIACVGDDNYGRDALARLQTEGVICDHVRKHRDEATGVALIFVADDGENSISVASGANATLDHQDVDAVPQSIWQASDVFLACLEAPLATVRHGLKEARRHQVTTMLNPAPAPDPHDLLPLLPIVDLLTPNSREASALSGIEVVDERSARAAAEFLWKQMRTHDETRADRTSQRANQAWPAVALTRGREGVVVVSADGGTWSVAAHRVQAVDATAAGDAFNGALGAAIAEQMPLADAVEFANAAAALAVTRLGAQPSLPYREEIDRQWRSK